MKRNLEEDDMVSEFMKFGLAAIKAFEEKGLEYGYVEFKCPSCGGTAWKERKHTPNNRSHTVTVRGGCSTCGYSMMN